MHKLGGYHLYVLAAGGFLKGNNAILVYGGVFRIGDFPEQPEIFYYSSAEGGGAGMVKELVTMGKLIFVKGCRK